MANLEKLKNLFEPEHNDNVGSYQSFKLLEKIILQQCVKF